MIKQIECIADALECLTCGYREKKNKKNELKQKKWDANQKQ